MNKRSGYTFFELLTVIGVTIIFGSVALLNLPTGLRSKLDIENAMGNLKAHLILVQQRAISQENGAKWGIHIDTSTPGHHFYQIFYGDTYESGTVVETIYLPDGLTFLSPAEGNSEDIIFEKVTGKTESGHSIIIGLASVSQDPQLASSNDALQSDILLAQQNALNGLDNSNWGIHADASVPGGNFYQLFYGNSYASGTIVKTVYLPDGVIFLSPGSGATADVIFEKNTGTVLTTDSIVLGSSSYNRTNYSNLTIASGTGLAEQLDTVPAFDTSLALSPSSATVQPGGSAVTVASVDILSGIPELTSFSATNLPAGTTASFSPVSCSPTCVSTLTLQTGQNTPDGTHLINVSATAGGLIKSATFSLAVNSQTVPSAPVNLSGTPGSGQAALSWQEPTLTGGSPIISYAIYRGEVQGQETLLVNVGNVLTYTDTGLVNGTTYYYKVVAINSVGQGTLSSESSVALSPTPPAAPANLSATPGNTQAVLNWQAAVSNGSAITSYKIYRSATSGGTLTQIGSVGGSILTYTDTGLLNGTTYYYKISAVNSLGEGGLSSEASAALATSPAGAPTNLTGATGDTQIVLSWQAPAVDGGSAIINYKVYRSAVSGGSLTLIVTVGNVLTYTDTGLVNGTTYYYKVSAVNGVGESVLSAESPALTPNNIVPAAPQNFVATAGINQAVLTWDAPASNGGSAVTYYKVYRAPTSGGAYSRIVTLGNVLTYTNTGLTTGTAYYYKVLAGNAAGDGSFSSEANATPYSTAPGVPTLTRTAALRSRVAVYWSAASANGATVTAYRVYRSTVSGGAATLIATTGNVLQYLDQTTVNGSSYYYRVLAVNSNGDGPLSNESNSSTPDLKLSAFITSTSYNANLGGLSGADTKCQTAATGAVLGNTWKAWISDSGTSAATRIAHSSTGYKLLNGTVVATSWADLIDGNILTPINFAQDGTTRILSVWTDTLWNGNILSTNTNTGTCGNWTTNNMFWYAYYGDSGWANFTWSSVGPGNNTYYNAACSTASALYCFEQPVAPSAPLSLTSTPGNLQATLNWQAPADDGGSAITNYKIYRGTSSGGETLLTTVGNVLTYTNTGLTGGTTYYYKVSAVTAIGESALSNEVNSAISTAVPSAPANLALTAGVRQISMTWSAPASNGGSPITNYRIYRGTSSGGETLFTTLGNVLNYTNTGLSNGTTYYYKVSAVNGVGESALTSESSATTFDVPSAPYFEPYPYPPTAVVVGSGQATLSWLASYGYGSAITNYKIYRSTSSGTETLLTTIGNVATYTDTGLTNGSTYYYKVSAVNGVGESVLSNEVSAQITTPGAPSSLTSISGNSQITLNWQAPSSGGSAITGYNIYRGTASGSETLVLNTGNALTSYTNIGLVSGEFYYYKITAVNSVGESSLSNETSTIASTPKRIFVTSTYYNANLGGLSGADAKCQTQANAASLGGTWKVWLSDSVTSAASRLSHFAGTYTLTNGTVVANNWNDLTDGALISPINITENSSVGLWTDVWTNTDPAGNSAGVNVCGNWTSYNGYSADYSPGAFYSDIGYSNYSGSGWTERGTDNSPTIHWCSNSRYLYCVEQ